MALSTPESSVRIRESNFEILFVIWCSLYPFYDSYLLCDKVRLSLILIQNQTGFWMKGAEELDDIIESSHLGYSTSPTKTITSLSAFQSFYKATLNSLTFYSTVLVNNHFSD